MMTGYWLLQARPVPISKPPRQVPTVSSRVGAVGIEQAEITKEATTRTA
jgi:hypothetical protein